MHYLYIFVSVLGGETPENNQILVYLYLYPKGFSLFCFFFHSNIFVVDYEPDWLRPDNSIKIIWPDPRLMVKKNTHTKKKLKPAVTVSFNMTDSRLCKSFPDHWTWSVPSGGRRQEAELLPHLNVDLTVCSGGKWKWKRISAKYK